MRELDARARCIFEVGEHYAREFWSDSSELQRSWAPLSCSGHLITGMATSNNALQCIRQSWWKSTFDTSTNLSNSSFCSSAAARHKKAWAHVRPKDTGTWWISFHLDKFLLAKLMWQSGGSFADSKLDRLVASPVNSYQHSILLHSLVVGGSSRHFECATKERMVSHLQHTT